MAELRQVQQDSTGEASLVLRPAVLGLLVLLGSMAAYLPSLGASFLVIDDPQYVTGNPYIVYPSWQKLWWFFAEVFEPSTVLGYYQPLAMASLMGDRVIEGWLSGGYTLDVDPFIFHLDNIFLHGVNAALIFFLVFLLTRSRAIGVFCGLVFALHPLNVEVVSWISQRKAILATMFALLMVLSHAQFARTGRQVWNLCTIAAFVAGILAKPTGLFLPAVLLLMDVWPLRRFSKQAVIEKLPLFVLAAIGGYVAYRSQTWGVDLTDQGEHRPLAVTLLVASHNLVFYMAKMILPVRLCPQYLMPVEESVRLAELPFLVGALGTLGLAGIGFWSLRRRLDHVWTLLASFALLIGPTLTPVRFIWTIAADRFAYTPMVVMLVLLGEVMRRALDRRPTQFGGTDSSVEAAARSARYVPAPMLAGGIAVLGLLAVQTVRQQAVWKDSFAYYQAVVDRFPGSASGYYGIGNAWLSRFQQEHPVGADEALGTSAELLDRALDAYDTTLRLDPTYSHAWYRVGHVLILRGRIEEGIATIRRGLSQDRADPEGYLFLGFAYTHAGMYAEAIEPYERCLARQPSGSEVRKNLANALLRTGRAAEALPHYERLYELDPTDLDGLQNWGVALLTVGETGKAVEKLQAVVDIRSRLTEGEQDASTLSPAGSGPDSPGRPSSNALKLVDARFTLAGALCQGGRLDEAAAELEKSLAIKPELFETAMGHPAFVELRKTAAWKELQSRHDKSGTP